VCVWQPGEFRRKCLISQNERGRTDTSVLRNAGDMKINRRTSKVAKTGTNKCPRRWLGDWVAGWPGTLEVSCERVLDNRPPDTHSHSCTLTHTRSQPEATASRHFTKCRRQHQTKQNWGMRRSRRRTRTSHIEGH